nr:protein CBFA2T3 [Camelus dromedarius]
MSQASPVLESGLPASASCSAPRGPRKGGPADRKEKAAWMSDSPAEVKPQPRATPPSMPPPSPATSQGATRHPSLTPHTNQEDGPAVSLPHGRFHGCLKWSMVCLLMNGSGHSPTAIHGAPCTPNGFSNGPATSPTASLPTQQLPPACGARQLSKLKRFLAALQQFGGDISPEIGGRVRTLVLGLDELHADHRGVPRPAPGGHQLPSEALCHPLPEGQSAPVAARTPALRPPSQADPRPVPGPARAAPAGC